MSGDLVLKHDHIVIYMLSFMYNHRDKKNQTQKQENVLQIQGLNFVILVPSHVFLLIYNIHL